MKNIALQLGSGITNQVSRVNEIGGFVNTTFVDVYTDAWLYDGMDTGQTILERIQSVNKRYIEAGYKGIPYHYVVTNLSGETANEPAYFVTKLPLTASGLNDKNISVCLCARPGTSLSVDSEQGVDNLINNLREVLKLIFNTLRISPKNLNLSTYAQNKSGQKSVNDGGSFKEALLEEIAKEHGFDSKQDYIVVAGPTDKNKRTLKNLSVEVCGSVNESFMNNVAEKSGLSKDYDAAIPLGTYLCMPAGTNYVIKNNSETKLNNITNAAASNLNSLVYANEYLNQYKGNVSYVNPNQLSYLTDRSKVELSTNRGGKDEPEWIYRRMEFPGYHNAFLQFERMDSPEEPVYLQFLIGPSDFSESRSNLYSNSKTMGGWITQRSGKNTISIQFSGYMLDIKSQMERHSFLENYKKYIEDEKVEDQTYVNYYRQKFVIEGREYYGHLVAVDFAKSADKQFLYKYNMSFLAYNDKKIYDANWSVLDMELIDQGIVSSAYLSQTVAEVTNSSQTADSILSGVIEKDTAAYKYLSNLIKSVGGNSAELEKIKKSLRSYSSNHWAKKYLDALIDANVVTNIEDWAYYDNPAPISHCIALACKVFVGGGTKAANATRWSSSYAEALWKSNRMSKDVYTAYSRENENSNMPRGWLLDIMCLSVIKKDASAKKLYDKSSKTSYDERSLEVLNKSGYINTPSEWAKFDDSITNGDVLAIIAKVGGYRAKD
jgi:hypothetical protein